MIDLKKIDKRYWRTAGVALLTILFIWVLWYYYMRSPWTRDGRIRSEVVKIAPEVPGTVADLRVRDNQFVHKGDILFSFDQERFKLALAQAEALLEQRRQDMMIKTEQAKRRLAVSDEALPQDQKQSYSGAAAMAVAAFEQARADRDVARLNLERSVLVSPVNGYVTNLQLRVGDYLTVGNHALSIVDSDAFYVLGYFEETKMDHLRMNAPVKIKLMGYGSPMYGHVESISRGISDLNAAKAEEGLANVNPIFTWVRLAQRIPVRIHIDKKPDDIELAAGMTCTIFVKRGQWQPDK
ncbi:MAG: HlyD family secretion protein [Verrucomicrobiales bacterium]|jgi:multidrug resistance efflux pump|nr:HlyD family secretion protein [Verrucomicrobiales bacterium]